MLANLIAPTKLDWRVYFGEFMRVHGPAVPYGGRLLFADGWQYSASDYKGPEWGPPDDPRQLWELKHAWAKAMALAADQAVRQAIEQVEAIKQAGHLRSAPLQQRRRYRGDEGKWVSETIPMNLEGMEAELTSLQSEAGAAAYELAQLEIAEPPCPPVHFH